MDGALWVLAAVCALCVFQGGCHVMRRLALRHSVSTAWYALNQALCNRHDMLDSVRRICRRHGLEAALGIQALAGAQRDAREAIIGDDFDRIVLAERQLDQRISALLALLAYHDTANNGVDSSELNELSACLSLANSAVDLTTRHYNSAVDLNNEEVRNTRLDWMVVVCGPAYAVAFRPGEHGSAPDQPYTLVA